MNTPTLILDVDEVLIDWLKPFHFWMEHTNRMKPDWRAAGAYRLVEHYPSLDQEEVVGFIRRFSASYEYRRLSPKPWVEVALKQIRCDFPDLPIVAISACGVDLTTVTARQWQLRGLPIDQLIPLEVNAYKAIAFSNYACGSVVIEDHPSHLKAAAVLGMKAVAFDQPWNRDLDFVDGRLTDWRNASSLLRGLLEPVAA